MAFVRRDRAHLHEHFAVAHVRADAFCGLVVLRLRDAPLAQRTCIRVGNERYARENDSFGLTTMRNRHVRVRGERIAFDFRGKSGRQHHVELEDARLARVIRRCRDLPGQDLFQYVDAEREAREAA